MSKFGDFVGKIGSGELIKSGFKGTKKAAVAAGSGSYSFMKGGAKMTKNATMSVVDGTSYVAKNVVDFSADATISVVGGIETMAGTSEKQDKKYFKKSKMYTVFWVNTCVNSKENS